MPASSSPQFGVLWEVAARERRGTLSRRAWRRFIGFVRTRFIKSGEQLDRRRARGVLNPCTRESRSRIGRFMRETLTSDHGLFSPYEGRQGAANGQESWGVSRTAQGFGRLDAGSRAGFASSRPPVPWTSVFQFSLFLYMCGLEKFGLVDQN